MSSSSRISLREAPKWRGSQIRGATKPALTIQASMDLMIAMLKMLMGHINYTIE